MNLDSQCARIQLENGRDLAYAEYGDPEGEPLIFCHGWPSSRSMAELADDAAKREGFRLISPDRPGIRDSAFQRNRKLLDWPPLLEKLAAHLGLEHFRLLAISGGAPYALAAAWALPHRVEAVALVSGAPPISELENESGLLVLYRWMLTVYKKKPELLRSLFPLFRPFAICRYPVQLRPLMLRFLQPCDAAVLRDTRAFDACFESQRAAWRASTAGVMADAEIFAQPWGFPLEEVQRPVSLWHGRLDRTFAWKLGEQMAGRLPNCRLHLVEEAGHYSLPIRHMPRILKDLRTLKS